MRLFHQDIEPWEVMDSKSIELVRTYSDGELQGTRGTSPSQLYYSEMQISRVCSTRIHRTYLCDLDDGSSLESALVLAQQKLAQDAAKEGYNTFLQEGWTVTRLRKGKRHRAEVRYMARPAYTATKNAQTPRPPFLGVLNTFNSV
ncbi:hypothetical protein BD414DRAFT_455941 [Trametes punicea]|nr:hypothetical protein BD414DRAFT_455941 [Trametes punicea]